MLNGWIWGFDDKLLENHDQEITESPVSIEKPLVTCEDLIEVRIKSVTRLTSKLGIKEGMNEWNYFCDEKL